MKLITTFGLLIFVLPLSILTYAAIGKGVSGPVHLSSIEPVPVELILLSANITGEGILITWQTSTEKNNQGFVIERKGSNTDWVEIGFVSGKGTTTEQSNYSFIDKKFFNGIFSYRLKQIDFNGTYAYTKEIEIAICLPVVFELRQNFPNPFNPATTIQYSIPQNGFVTLKVYDILGNEVAILVNEEKPTGTYEVKFDGNKLSNGIYFYRLQMGKSVLVKNLILLK